MATTAKGREFKGQKQIKTIDSQGRIILSKELASTMVEVEQIDEFEFRIRMMDAIPKRESWLAKNPKALASVKAGLAEAAARKFVAGPDVAADLAEFGDED